MILMDIIKMIKAILAGICGIIVVAAIFYFCFLYGLSTKTDKVYSAAIEDFKKGNYQNSYYLFSKVSYFSPLKPAAIYHRGECAQMLEDSNSAIKQYTFLYRNYPKNSLSLRAKYLAAQELTKVNPQKAKRHFNNIMKTAPNTDYAIASEYYLGQLIVDKFTDKDGNISDMCPKSQRLEAEKYFRHYLTKAPAGKHAFKAVNSWLKLNTQIASDDYLLMAKTAYNFSDYDKALELLNNTPISDSWALYVKTFYAKPNMEQVNAYVRQGVKNYSSNVSEQDFQDAVYLYINSAQSKIAAADELLSYSPKGADYIMNLKCEMLPQSQNESCYNSLYIYDNNGKFAPKALSEIFMAKIRTHDYRSAQKIGRDYLNKFPASEYEPMIMFWLAKLAEGKGDNQESNHLYNLVLMKYPDCYWAYRAYIRLNRLNTAIIVNKINNKPIEYPYRYVNKKLIENLVRLNDYDIIEHISNGDEFVKSWILYKRGDLSHSIIVARDAMAKLDKKPDKYDLRWRLVYPLHYWDTIKHYSSTVANNIPLMMSVMREESYFDPKAQSVVGASGLMQLMPTTASEIAKSYEIEDEDINLFDIDCNIMLGNYYYAQLRSILNGLDVSAIAAYNGGIGNVQNWKSSIFYNDTDEFVEKIPYPETKDYVKKVFRSYWNYIRIYAHED